MQHHKKYLEMHRGQLSIGFSSIWAFGDFGKNCFREVMEQKPDYLIAVVYERLGEKGMETGLMKNF